MKRLIAALWVLPLGAAADQPARTEFAYQAPIAIEQPGRVYRAPLTVDVYRGVTRQDLGDMRVFNAAGEVVPHGLVRSDLDAAKRLNALPVFSIPLGPLRTGSGTAVHVHVNETGAIVDVNKTVGPGATPRAYLVDASQTKEPIVAIEINLGTIPPDGFLGILRVEQSNDLNNWQGTAQGAIANLQRGDQRLEQTRLTLPRQRYKYLRLSWTDAATEQAVVAIMAELSAPAEPRRDWVRLDNAQEGQAAGYRYVSDVNAPIDRARILLEKNSVARVTILSRAKDGDVWTHRGEKTVYLLQTDAGEIQDNEIRLSRANTATQWLLRFADQPNGGTAVPILELGWTPHELVFIARGDPPFTLAYGRVGTGTIEFGIDEVIRRSKREDGERVEIRPATFGPATALRGEAARSGPWYGGDWKQWLLWIVLVIGVGTLAYLAVRLSKQIGTDTAK